jgi:hypothetical protein
MTINPFTANPLYVASMREERKVYKALVGKPKGKRPLERPRH